MHKLSTFQIAVIGVFIFFTLLAVGVFSGIIPFFSNAPEGVGGEAVLWGTLPAEHFRDPLEEMNRTNEGLFKVVYVEKDARTFDDDLVEALASGRGPDMILLPQELIVRHADKAYPLPYENMSVRSFRDTFVEEGELYLVPEGILGLPFSVDPLVMYWNRDMFSSAGISVPPATWDEFFTLVPMLTKIDNARNVLRSGVSFGEFSNVEHAKEILALLILQAGNPITEKTDSGYMSVLAENRGMSTNPAQSALRFYTEFSNPAKTTYSWNRSLPSSKDVFIAGDLAMYFGFASELDDIEKKSPHLNFDIAPVPQAKDAIARMTYGNMQAITVLKSSKNPTTTFYAASFMTSPEFNFVFSTISALPPPRRDLLRNIPPSAFGKIFYNGALTARGWFDPSPEETTAVFKTMVENTVSGKERISDAVVRASASIQTIIPKPIR